MLPGETLCKLVQIFPPKVLVYVRKKFLDTLLIENTLLETNKCFTECDLLSERQTLYFWLVY